MEQGSKTVSKTTMARAVRLVGLPDKSPVVENFKQRFPRLHTATIKIGRTLKKIGQAVGKYWQTPVFVALSVAALFISINYAFNAVAHSRNYQPEGNWQTIETTIGRVRTYMDISPSPMADQWIFSWPVDAAYAAIFLVLAIAILRLRRAKYRLGFALVALACVFSFATLWQAQRQVIEQRVMIKNSYVAGTEPLKPRLAYLQQCGDEINYVFDDKTRGMLFRSLRDQGFAMTIEIPTNYGHPDLKLLCIEYDKLRKNHDASDIVLQLATKQSDGTLRPYMFSDMNDNTAVYGFYTR